MFYEELDSFVKCSATHTKTRANIDNVAITSAVMEALYKSAELGKEVNL
jgi:hypothetical protein